MCFTHFRILTQNSYIVYYFYHIIKEREFILVIFFFKITNINLYNNILIKCNQYKSIYKM